MKTKFLLIPALALMSLTAIADNLVINIAKLPAQSQSFVKKFFPKGKVAIVTTDNDLLDTEYEVIFTNGTSIEFDNAGKWKEIDCKAPNTIPDEIIDAKIGEFIKLNYPDNKVIAIDLGRKKTELKLDNRIELKFNKAGQLVDIDVD